MSLQIRRLRSAAPDFAAELDALAATEPVADPALTRAVADILARVRAEGDAALLDYARRFDASQAESAAALGSPMGARPTSAPVYMPVSRPSRIEVSRPGASNSSSHTTLPRRPDWNLSDIVRTTGHASATCAERLGPRAGAARARRGAPACSRRCAARGRGRD